MLSHPASSSSRRLAISNYKRKTGACVNIRQCTFEQVGQRRNQNKTRKIIQDRDKNTTYQSLCGVIKTELC